VNTPHKGYTVFPINGTFIVDFHALFKKQVNSLAARFRLCRAKDFFFFFSFSLSCKYKMKKLVILGGGAAGFMTAVRLRRSKVSDMDVVLVDNKVKKKK
jgi:NADPH-dependent 2,4-dienoyl-CoA reductase/sulfur reductase-like enzyme